MHQLGKSPLFTIFYLGLRGIRNQWPILLRNYLNSNLLAFDFDRTLVQRLEQKILQTGFNNRAGVFTGDIQSPLDEIDNEQVELIITSGTLEYVSQEETIKNLSRFLAPGGYFLNSPVRNTSWGMLITKIYGCRPYSREQNLEAFEKNGFALQKITTLPWYAPASYKEAHLFKKTVKI